MPDPTLIDATGAWPTADQLEQYLARIRPSDRRVVLDALLTQAQAGASCIERDHTGELASLFHVATDRITTAHRYRTAWQSARSRAQRTHEALTDVLSALLLVDDAPVALVLNETTETVTWGTPEAQAERHTHDLVLASTATLGTRCYPCQTMGDDWIHTAGPCPDLEAPR